MRAMLSRLANGAADMETTVVQRLGRVIYWVSMAAIGMIVVATVALLSDPTKDRDVIATLGLIVVVATYAFGRAALGVCYFS